MGRSFKKTTTFVVGYHHVLLREQLNQEFCFVFENARRPRDKEAQSKAESGTFYKEIKASVGRECAKTSSGN